MSKLKRYLQSRDQFLNHHINDLLDASFDGIVITDAEGTVLFTNAAYEKLSGISRDAMVGENLRVLIDAGVLEGAVALQVTRTKVPTTTTHRYAQTGKMAMVTGNPVFNETGNMQYVIANFRDVTQLSKWYKDLGHSIEEDFNKGPLYLNYELANMPDYGLLIQNHLMRECLHMALRVAKFDTHILILGESGSGKTKLAEIIHKASARAKGPFISINCGSIPENLLESEFYGYEKGAFTGANIQGKKGQFEMASGGTLVLDEVSELSMAQQVKLLKAIEEDKIYKVGGESPLHVDVRVIAVSNRDLKCMVRDGLFRKDLYFRLNVVPITVPSLRDRLDEIPLLVKHFFHEFNNKYGIAKYPSPDLLQHLCRLEYSGNVRELKNLVERMFIMSARNMITNEDLISCCGDTGGESLSRYFTDETSLEDFMNQCESEALAKATKESTTLKEASQRLGISKASLWRKLKKHGLGKRAVIQHGTEHS